MSFRLFMNFSTGFSCRICLNPFKNSYVFSEFHVSRRFSLCSPHSCVQSLEANGGNTCTIRVRGGKSWMRQKLWELFSFWATPEPRWWIWKFSDYSILNFYIVDRWRCIFVSSTLFVSLSPRSVHLCIVFDFQRLHSLNDCKDKILFRSPSLFNRSLWRVYICFSRSTPALRDEINR